MARRTIEVSSEARLKVRLNQLIVEKHDGQHSIPFEDIGFLILDNPQTTLSQSVIHHCAQENIGLIVTNEKHLPTSLLLPLEAHSTQGKIMRLQSSITEDVKHVIWQQIIQAKILAQSEVLIKVHGIQDARLIRLATSVQPADIGNHEAQASRIYFKLLYGRSFRRDYKTPDNINILLNYGYSLVRAACARALMGTGLHPAFGIHHHNQYNTFCLADDMMEPLRPLIDKRVVDLSRANTFTGLGRNEKNYLLETLSAPVLMQKRKTPLMSALTSYCSNLREILENRKRRLRVPTAI